MSCQIKSFPHSPYDIINKILTCKCITADHLGQYTNARIFFLFKNQPGAIHPSVIYQRDSSFCCSASHHSTVQRNFCKTAKIPLRIHNREVIRQNPEASLCWRQQITDTAFRYDLNQIPYEYTVKVRNRFKGLDLIDREPDELWTQVCDILQETGIKTIPREKKCRKAKWLSEEALQIALKRREAKSKGEKERYSHLNAEFQRIARRDKKIFLSDQCKEIEENNRWERLEISLRKLEIPREYFMQKWAQ